MVEIIPKEAYKPSKRLNILFYFAIFLLLLSVGGYFTLNNFLQKAENDLAVLEQEISQIMTPEKVALEQEVLTSKNEIDKFANLINQHLETSKVFGIIQRATHPQVWFTRFDLNSRQKTFGVSGETQSFETLGQQILIMRNEEAISTVELDALSIGSDGRVEFILSFSLKPDTF